MGCLLQSGLRRINGDKVVPSLNLFMLLIGQRNIKVVELRIRKYYTLNFEKDNKIDALIPRLAKVEI